MKNKLMVFLLISLIVFGVFGVYLMTGIAEKPASSEKENKEIAKKFVKNSETFKFDGFDLKYIETLYPEIVNHPNLYVFVFEFKTLHGGYGDRTGEPVLEVITHHEAEITIENGHISKAFLNQEWDMINQTIITE